MLKPGGVFYVDKPGMTSSGTIEGGVEIHRSYRDEFLRVAKAAGLVLLAEDNDRFPASRYKKAIGRIEPPATFVKPTGGGRRRTHTRRKGERTGKAKNALRRLSRKWRTIR